ncbi:ATP-grasp domain-containing protein [Desulfogranum mediterraneum]|uniref:ATP-grasp domain-containing protein n=1 Tax=Desulfogranum mediterraneum TaxID=160661 RepID=UPI000407F51A|nr:ATP-grasp domain-containing protein [Desulfogranum mediterraneum]
MKKKILLLGGSYFQVPSIKYAKDAGYHVVTCDYLPDNPGHKYADEYYNVSTTDMEAVLELASRLKIDGILAYASDPAALTAAYVAEKLGLPSNPYRSVEILSRKDLFRAFLRSHGFNAPLFCSVKTLDEAKKALLKVKYPVVVKPVDSSGSKGVTKLSDTSELQHAFEYALHFSRDHSVIIEEFVCKKGAQVGGDGFVSNGLLSFRCFGDQVVDTNCNPYVPVGMTFPSKISCELQEQVHTEIQRALSLLGFKFGAINLEVMIDKNDDIYLMEIGPRSGGNCLPEIISIATGIDMVKYAVEYALGYEDINFSMHNPKSFFSYHAIHSKKDGKLLDVSIDNEISNNILKKYIIVENGSLVKKFNGSNCTIGIFLLKFDSAEEMYLKTDKMDLLVRVAVA